MKRIIYILFIFSILILIVSILIKPFVLFIAKRQLGRLFIESRVSIRDCDLKSLHLLTFSDIEINKGKIYDFKIKDINIQYKPLSILKRNIPNISLKDAVITVYLPQESMLEISQRLNPGTGNVFLVQRLELVNMNLDLKLKDLNLQAKVSLGLSLTGRLINYLDLEIGFLDSQGFHLEDANLKFSQKEDSGELYVNKLKYGKLKIEEIKSKARLKEEVLFLDSLSAKVLEGQLKGDLSFRIDQEREYLANLEFVNLNLAKFVDDFNLDKKFQVTGSLSGAVAFNGKGSDINTLAGDFSAAESGGIMVIKDNSILENLARNSKQPLDILVESFRDYHYNTGIMKLSLDKGNLVLDIALDGETGKRNLNITLHDFRLKREGL